MKIKEKIQLTRRKVKKTMLQKKAMKILKRKKQAKN